MKRLILCLSITALAAVSLLAMKTHTVKPGETLASIAHGFGITAQDLKSYNHLASDQMKAGQVLKIPKINHPATKEPASKAPADLPAQASAPASSPKTAPESEPAAVPAAETAALIAAQSWLALVDAGQYGDSWNQAAQVFKGAVSKDQWQQAMQTIRSQLGANLTRKLVSKKHLTSLPGAPDGEYVVIEFMASFQNKQTAVETVTPMLDKDGTWRVSGYFIK